ncbi:MAG: hypothetical protein GF349_01035 [Candidatus Magasanikbacteria bacterium]|nr:hypothetical protein [Candidatus Magasanikbacteria bacterium]
MKRQEQVFHILEKCGALISGHVQLRSGKHSQRFLDMRRAQLFPESTETLVGLLSEQIKMNVTGIVGRSPHCVVFAHELAKMLARNSKKDKPLSLQSMPREKSSDGNPLVYFDHLYSAQLNGETIGIIEDVGTTDATMKAMIQATRDCGAEVTFAAYMCNRGGITAEQLGVEKLYSLLEISKEDKNWQFFKPDECPYCAQGQQLEWKVDDSNGLLVPA